MTMRVAVLSSGGKDSAAAWWWATCQGWTVVGLVTVTITGDDSPMFQIPSTHMVRLQAEQARLPWFEVEASGETPGDIEALEAMLNSLEIDGFVSETTADSCDCQFTTRQRLVCQREVQVIAHSRGEQRVNL